MICSFVDITMFCLAVLTEKLKSKTAGRGGEKKLDSLVCFAPVSYSI